MLSIRLNAKAKKVEDCFPDLIKRFRKGIRNGAHDAGNSVVKRVQRLLTTGSRTGSKYPGLPYRSSAPGEPPRSQRGRLEKSGYYDVRGSNELAVGENTGKKIEIYLEKGTTRMKPRPHVITAINLEERNTEKYLHNGVLKEIKV